MRTIEQIYHIRSTLEKVWNALVKQDEIENWGAGPAIMSSEEDFEFKLWGGDVYGKNLQVVKYKKLVQEWFEVESDHPTRVVFDLRYKDGVTTVRLTHSNVEEKRVKSLSDGWKRYYLGPMKEYLESN